MTSPCDAATSISCDRLFTLFVIYCLKLVYRKLVAVDSAFWGLKVRFGGSLNPTSNVLRLGLQKALPWFITHCLTWKTAQPVLRAIGREAGKRMKSLCLTQLQNGPFWCYLNPILHSELPVQPYTLCKISCWLMKGCTSCRDQISRICVW